MVIDKSGNFGFNAPLPAATVQINGGIYAGSAAVDPGLGNIRASGNVTADGVVVATGGATLHNYVYFPDLSPSLGVALDANRYLTNTISTLAELNFMSGVTTNVQTALNVRVLIPIIGTGDPTTTGAVAAGPGQFYIDSATMDTWLWYTNTVSHVAFWKP